MDETANLSLPYLMPQQAQKYVTHNEALRDLDSIVQLAVLDRHLATPPATPAAGDRYIVAPSPTGAWTSQAGRIAAFQDGLWLFYAPQTGWRVWIEDEALLVAWNGSAWVVAGGLPINPASMIGVLATADTTNRLSVKSDAALFANDDLTPGTGNMRIAVSKASAAKDASVTFEDGFSGRAMLGLLGDDHFHIKVSPDGTAWRESLRIAKDTGVVSFPSGVGDPFVILATGQSNFTRTPAYAWAPPANLSIWNWDGVDGHVGTAFAAADATTINVSWEFAAEIARRFPERNVLLINVSFAGQAISHWKTGAASPDVYANLTANIAPALTIAGIAQIDVLLWWQGESDAAAPNAYQSDFETVVTRFRGESWFRRTTPIVVFGITSLAISGSAAYGAFSNVLQACVAAEPDTRMFVYPADLPQAYWDAPTSYLHLTGAGYYLAGFMAAHAFLDGVGRRVLQNTYVDVENKRLVFNTNAAPLPAPPAGTQLHIGAADGSADRIVLDSYGTGAIAPTFSFRRSRGTAASPSAVQTDDGLFSVSAMGYGATAYSSGGRGGIVMAAAENWSDTAQGSYMQFYSVGTGTAAAAERMRILAGGNVGIGTTSPAQLLDVSGALSAAAVNAASLFRLTRPANSGVKYGNAAEFLLGSYSASISSNSRLDLQMADGSTSNPDATVMTWQANGNVGIGTTTPSDRLEIAKDDGNNAVVTELMRLTHTTSGTPGVGIGTGIEFQVETATGNNLEIGMTLDAVTTNVTGAAENFDFVVKLMSGGSTASEAFRVKSGGKISLPSGSFSANGSVATALSSLGPTGAHTAVQKWLVLDDAGTARYVPCF